jgi:hypothetical protein
MADRQRVPGRHEVVLLWESGKVSCVRVTRAHNRIEITLAVEGYPIFTRVFFDHNEAADFALEKMRAYNGR